MKKTTLTALVLSLAVVGAGFIPFISEAWGPQGGMQQHYVTAQYWCGSYYSSYPCQQQYQQPQYPQYQAQQYYYNSSSYSYTYQQQYTPTYYYPTPTTYAYQYMTNGGYPYGNSYYPTTYAYQNLTNNSYSYPAYSGYTYHGW